MDGGRAYRGLRTSGHGPDPARTGLDPSELEGSRFAAVLSVPGYVTEHVERTQRCCLRSSGALVCRRCRKYQVSGGRFKKKRIMFQRQNTS